MSDEKTVGHTCNRCGCRVGGDVSTVASALGIHETPRDCIAALRTQLAEVKRAFDAFDKAEREWVDEDGSEDAHDDALDKLKDVCRALATRPAPR